MARFPGPEARQEPGPKPRQVRERKIKAAQAFLQQALTNGPRPAREVETEAQMSGIAHATLQVARERERIVSTRQGSQWIWTAQKRRRQAANK